MIGFYLVDLISPSPPRGDGVKSTKVSVSSDRKMWMCLIAGLFLAVAGVTDPFQ